MHRRFFLFTAGSAAVSAQAPASRQLVVGLIGVGFRGLQLLRQCLSIPYIRVGAVCETYESRMFGAVALARSKGHTTRAYRIYADLIADSDMDAILIATPDFSHHRMTLDALGARKHVYVEQPLCLTWQEGVELLNAEKGSRQIIQVGSQRRSSPFFLEMSHEIGAGRIGEIRMVQANRTSSYLRAGVLRRACTPPHSAHERPDAGGCVGREQTGLPAERPGIKRSEVQPCRHRRCGDGGPRR